MYNNNQNTGACHKYKKENYSYMHITYVKFIIYIFLVLVKWTKSGVKVLSPGLNEK